MPELTIGYLIDQEFSHQRALTLCLQKIILPEDVWGYTLREVMAKLKSIPIPAECHDGWSSSDFSVQNPFTGIRHCCRGNAWSKIPYVDGMLTPEELKMLIGKHVDLPEEHLVEIVADVISPCDLCSDLSFPQIISMLKSMWYEYYEKDDAGEELLLFENPFNGKSYAFINGEPADV